VARKIGKQRMSGTAEGTRSFLRLSNRVRIGKY
jgi:hypothetical protein